MKESSYAGVALLMAFLTRRRCFALTLGGAVGYSGFFAAFAKELEAEKNHRDLRFQIGKGFGEGLHQNIEAVLRSSAETIWLHCTSTHWQIAGFSIYQHEHHPICHFDHTADSCVLIGLATKQTFWAQYAFQFAHEFCHALIGHSSDWRKRNLRQAGPNFWLEECLCEVASLFSLRAMSEAWRSQPPYPNWKDYAQHLMSYAAERMEKTRQAYRQPFRPWFAEVENELRKNPTMREHNCRIALELLPLFEAQPAGWDSLQHYRMSVPSEEQTLQEHFEQWFRAADCAQHEFIRKVGSVFGVKISQK